MKSPRVLFISKEGTATFWFLVAAGAVIWSGWYVSSLVTKTALRPQYLIMTNPDVVKEVPDMDPDREDDIARAQTQLAMDSIFNKSSSGLDAADRCKKLLSPNAWSWVQSELVDKQSEVFRDAHMHQKVEVETIELRRQAAGHAILASVHGQLLRSGILAGKLFNEVWAVRAEVMWTRNINLRTSGRYPTLCSAFNCRETPVASTLRREAADQPKAGAPATTEGHVN